MSTNDLDWLLTPGAKEPGKTKAQKRRDEKERRRHEALEAQKKAEEALHRAAEAMALWEPQAIVRIFYQTSCSCGRRFLVPEIYPQSLPVEPLIRFQHKRTGEIWEKRCKAGNVPPGLPLVHRELSASTPCCPECHEEEELSSLLGSPQLDLFH